MTPSQGSSMVTSSSSPVSGFGFESTTTRFEAGVESMTSERHVTLCGLPFTKMVLEPSATPSCEGLGVST